MRILLFVFVGLIALFVFLGQLDKDKATQVDIYSTIISNASSRYWDQYLKDQLSELNHEDRKLVYDFMERYHNFYVDRYRGPITFGDAVFYQKLTGGFTGNQSKDIANENIIRMKDNEINQLRSQVEHLQRLHELALKNISNQSSAATLQTDINTQIPDRPIATHNTSSQEVVSFDRDAVYRSYGVFELEEQLRKSQTLDRQDPQWRMYQTDSPHTQDIRRLLMEARQAADNSMR